MKKQINRHLPSCLLTTIAVILALGASHPAAAQKGIGKQYNSRDPRSCADQSTPKAGALSAAKAAEYVVCENEGINGDKLYFVEDVKVQIGAGRRYNPAEDINFSGIDTKYPVYPIRGSYKSYQCTAIFPDKTNTNRNCVSYDAPKATGACYRKDFGEWRCMLVDIHQTIIEDNIPPPGGAQQNANQAENRVPDAARPPEKRADRPAPAKAGMPAPDFSEMEEWFEIVRYEYPKPPDREMWIYFKPKVDGNKRPYIFYAEFRDKDGITVQSADASPVCCSDALMMTANGETAKVRVQLPPESIMKQVTEVRVVRAK